MLFVSWLWSPTYRKWGTVWWSSSRHVTTMPTVRGMRVVNICFHGIGSPRGELEPGEDAYWVPNTAFLRLLDLVTDRKDVRLSFDDGNSSDVEVALPALQERGLKATFFVVAGRLDRRGSLDRDDVRRLHAAGMTIGNHGLWHRPWRGLPAAHLDEEVMEARHLLADVTDSPIRDAALPLGRYDRRVLSRLRALDYDSVQTSDRRWAHTERWLQPRYSIRSSDTPRSLEQEVLTMPPAPVRARGMAVGAIKRLR